MSGLAELVVRLSRPETLPDGAVRKVLDAAAEAEIATSTGAAPREIQLAACDAGIIPLRYLRNFHQFSMADQIRLLRSRVALVGLGGLGGWVLEGLARLGVGTLRAADPDGFEQHNLNRQLLATTSTLAWTKAEAARARLEEVNPAVRADLRATRADAAGWDEFLDGADLVLDCLGGAKDRPALIRAAAKAGLPLITGGVAGATGFVGTVLPGGVSPGDVLCPAPTENGGCGAETALGCQIPAIYVVCGHMLAQAADLLTGKPPALAGKALLIDVQDATRIDVLDLS